MQAAGPCAQDISPLLPLPLPLSVKFPASEPHLIRQSRPRPGQRIVGRINPR